MKTDEDEAFEQIEKAQGWRKRQIADKINADKINADFDYEYAIHKRNEVLEEVAQAVEKFRGAFGNDTISSFAIYIRGMKR